MADKVTIMILKVDLHCSSCYKKIKRLLCKFPQIRDQIYNEKQNQVMITVVCCSPEKFRDKLCCKGGKVIKSIEIKEPEKPKDAENRKELEKQKTLEKPKDLEKEKIREKPELEKQKTLEKPKDLEKEKIREKPEPEKHPNRGCCGPCSQGLPGGPCYHGGYGVAPPSPPNWGCCGQCSQGLPGGPCYHGGYGVVPPLPPNRGCCGSCSQGLPGGPCYHGGYGVAPPSPPRPIYDSCGYYGGGGNRGCYVSRCEYFNEENSQGCSIM